MERWAQKKILYVHFRKKSLASFQQASNATSNARTVPTVRTAKSGASARTVVSVTTCPAPANVRQGGRGHCE